MKSPTKAQNIAFEKSAMNILNELFGEPEVDTYEMRWAFPLREGSTSIKLILDSKDSSNFSESWIASRFNKPKSWFDEQGFLKAKYDLNWPTSYTYPSGKLNLHPDYSEEDFENEILDYVMSMVDENTEYFMKLKKMKRKSNDG